MDYKNPEIIKYVYLDIEKKSPDIDYALFSRTGKYLFLKAKDKDDIYSLLIDRIDGDISIKINVPSSPYYGLTYIKPISIDNLEDTFVAQYQNPARLIVMSAESNTTYQNQIVLDSQSYILDVFTEGRNLYAIIVNFWLKYIKITSIYPVAENQKEQVKIFADDFKIIGYSATRDILTLQYESNALSIRFIRPVITDKSAKFVNKEFSFNPISSLFGYSEKFNAFYFISGSNQNKSGKTYYQFNHINLNNDNTIGIKIDFVPKGLFSINDSSYLMTHDYDNNNITLINFLKETKSISYIGLKYFDLMDL